MSTVDNAVSHGSNEHPNSIANIIRVQEPCPFLEIPTELRLMIYELIPVRISEHCYDHKVDDESYPVRFPVPCITVGILATSRQVQDEAADIMEKKIAKIRKIPLRIKVDTMLLYYLHTSMGPFQAINTYVKLATRADEVDDNEGDHENELSQVRSHLSSYLGLWFARLEIACKLSKTTPTVPMVEVGIWFDKDDPFAEAHVCQATLMSFARGLLGGNSTQTDLHYVYRLIQDEIPENVVKSLNPYHWPGSRHRTTHIRIGRHIDSVEYENEWRALDGLQSFFTNRDGGGFIRITGSIAFPVISD
jgi:hypothetical protein